MPPRWIPVGASCVASFEMPTDLLTGYPWNRVAHPGWKISRRIVSPHPMIAKTANWSTLLFYQKDGFFESRKTNPFQILLSIPSKSRGSVTYYHYFLIEFSFFHIGIPSVIVNIRGHHRLCLLGKDGSNSDATLLVVVGLKSATTVTFIEAVQPSFQTLTVYRYQETRIGDFWSEMIMNHHAPESVSCRFFAELNWLACVMKSPWLADIFSFCGLNSPATEASHWIRFI